MISDNIEGGVREESMISSKPPSVHDNEVSERSDSPLEDDPYGSGQKEPEEEQDLEIEEIPKPVDYYLHNFGTMENPIVFSGEIYRFKPGLQNNFIARWF